MILIRQLFLSLAFFTRLRIPFPLDLSKATLAGAVWAFPVAGIAVGGLAAGVFLLAFHAGLGAVAAGWLAVIAQIWFTGGLHEDGLADTADAMAFGRDREQKLAIMRDSRIGSFGVLALVCIVGLRAALIASLPPAKMLCALVLAGALSRSAMAVLLSLAPFAREDGLAAMAGKPGGWAMFLCVLLTLALAFNLSGMGGVLMLGAVAAASLLMVCHLAMRHFGGITGDVLGAAQQFTEASLLMALCLLAA